MSVESREIILPPELRYSSDSGSFQEIDDSDENGQEEPSDETWLDVDFDLTPNHLVRLFHSLKTHKRSYLTYEETLQALALVSRSLPTYSAPLDENHAMQIIKVCDMDRSGNISCEEFVNTVQTFAMTYLLSESQGTVHSFFCADYDEERAQCRYIDPEAWDKNSARPGTISFREFIEEDPTRPRFSDSTVRWIHLSGTKVGTIITLGNRYGLHPLTLEDIINFDERPRLEVGTDGSTQLILSVLSPKEYLETAVSQSSIRPVSSTAPPNFRFPTSNPISSLSPGESVSRTPSGGASSQDETSPNKGTSNNPNSVHNIHAFKSTEIKRKRNQYRDLEDDATIQGSINASEYGIIYGSRDKSKKKSSSDKGWFSSKKKDLQSLQLHLYSHQLNIILVNERTVLTFQKKPSDLLDPLLSRIAYHGSKIRMNGARFLVYSIIDKVIDGLFPVMKQYQRELRKLQAAVHSAKTTQLSTIKEVQHINREMNYCLLWLRPMEGIVTKMADHFSPEPELQRHLEDLKDHVQTLVDQVQTMITWSQSLNDDYLNEQQCRMNQVMYVLTLVTTVFIPAQFLAGVYGMNFVYMPALDYHWGYFLFWLGIVVISSAVVAWFHRQGWISWS